MTVTSFGGVAVGGTDVAVGGTRVAVGETGVAVGGTAVAVGGTGVAVGGTRVAVGGTGVGVGVAQAARVSTKIVDTNNFFIVSSEKYNSRRTTLRPPSGLCRERSRMASRRPPLTFV